MNLGRVSSRDPRLLPLNLQCAQRFYCVLSCLPIGKKPIIRREWVKVHLMCGVNTKVVTAVDISGWAANYTTYFIPLVERTAQHFEL